jgi:Fuc2NAc and GlcNAc transferase
VRVDINIALVRALWLTTLVPIFVSFVLTFLMRRVSLSRGLMDVPNERSSHVAPTPRGGGVAIVFTSLASFGVLLFFRLLDLPLFAALTGGGLAVALVGLIDDRRPLSARTRLVVHIAAALWALLWLAGTAGLHDARVGAAAELVGFLLAVTAVVWVLNLYNFMDGIDGIAASEAVFVSWAGAFLLLASGSSGLALVALAFGASCCGFLLWNWPPAKIFIIPSRFWR